MSTERGSASLGLTSSGLGGLFSTEATVFSPKFREGRNDQMKNTHSKPDGYSIPNDCPLSNLANVRSNDDLYPDAYAVAKLLGHKGDRFPLKLTQVLMSDILDSAPQRPQTRPVKSK